VTPCRRRNRHDPFSRSPAAKPPLFVAQPFLAVLRAN
jgi:hypothetical protein